MKPVMQTKENNCFAACLASLLELSCDEVPNFVGEDRKQIGDWLPRCSKWLNGLGLELIMIDEIKSNYIIKSNTPCIFSVDSPREGYHAIIGTWTEVGENIISICLHDPWPDSTQHVKEIEQVYYSYYLVSLRPNINKTEKDIKATAKTIIKKILTDFTNRRGLKHEWEHIEGRIKREIVAEWLKSARESITKGGNHGRVSKQ